MQKSNVEEQLKRVVSKYSSTDKECINANSRLRNDLKLNMQTLSLVMFDMKDCFTSHTDDKRLLELETFEDLLKYIIELG